MWLAFIVSFMLHLKFSLLDVTFVSELSKKKTKETILFVRHIALNSQLDFFIAEKEFKAVTNLISLAFAKNIYSTVYII